MAFFFFFFFEIASDLIRCCQTSKERLLPFLLNLHCTSHPRIIISCHFKPSCLTGLNSPVFTCLRGLFLWDVSVIQNWWPEDLFSLLYLQYTTGSKKVSSISFAVVTLLSSAVNDESWNLILATVDWKILIHSLFNLLLTRKFNTPDLTVLFIHRCLEKWTLHSFLSILSLYLPVSMMDPGISLSTRYWSEDQILIISRTSLMHIWFLDKNLFLLWFLLLFNT